MSSDLKRRRDWHWRKLSVFVRKKKVNLKQEVLL
jgi:hypothetical protein